MAVSAINAQRYRAILIGREVKHVFRAVPEVMGLAEPAWLWRYLFLAEPGRVHRAGEVILADLRAFAGLDRPTIFDADPHLMAFREGKRAAVMRILNYLNLDEAAVQELMELDDGLSSGG
jgi:hypothetical protein